MPWTETCVMQERVKFIMDVLDGTYCMSELCRYYGISRKTGYKWVDRYRQAIKKAFPKMGRTQNQDSP